MSTQDAAAAAPPAMKKARTVKSTCPVVIKLEWMIENEIIDVSGKTTVPTPSDCYELDPIFKKIDKNKFRNKLNHLKTVLSKNPAIIVATPTQETRKPPPSRADLRAVVTGIALAARNDAKVELSQESEDIDTKKRAALSKERKEELRRMYEWKPFMFRTRWDTHDGFERVFIGVWLNSSSPKTPVTWEVEEGNTLVLTATWPDGLSDAHKLLDALPMMSRMITGADYPLVMALDKTLIEMRDAMRIGDNNRFKSVFKIDIGMHIHSVLRPGEDCWRYDFTESAGSLLVFNLVSLTSSKNKGGKQDEITNIEM